VAAQLIASAKSLADVPASPLYSVAIHQTPASVAAQVSSVRHDLTPLDIAGIWLPLAAGLIGLLLIALGFSGRRRAAAQLHGEAAPAQPASA
jgi:hypothetical protein